MALLFLCLIFGTGRTQKIEAADTETDQAAAAQDELLAELDFDAIQQEVDSLLSSQQFSFAGTVRSLLQEAIPSAPSVPEMPFSPVPKQHSLRRRG